MTLAAGSKLGPYEIVVLLGASGMGEVYRAHDTKLNRDVALKVLPAEFASDPERMGRFKREAQLLAQLCDLGFCHAEKAEPRSAPACGFNPSFAAVAFEGQEAAD